MQKELRVVAFFCLMFGLSVSIYSQDFRVENIDEAQWEKVWTKNKNLVFNHSKAQVIMGVSENKKFVRLVNQNNSAMTEIAFGCVVVDEVDKLFSVTSEFIPKYFKIYQNTELKPGKDLVFGAELSGIGQCLDSGHKLTITKLVFDDESTWRIRESESLQELNEESE